MHVQPVTDAAYRFDEVGVAVLGEFLAQVLYVD
ncbi:MAG: hypothetical protein RL021_2098, partial [Bacteroidota bacterium]